MIQNIPITKIHPHPNNPRTDLGNLDELAESMKTAGILQNLTVVKDPKKKDRYIVVIGHRRLAAAKTAGLTEVPCTVAEMDEKTQIATMLLENIQRADLTVWEQAKGFQMMMDLGESQESISEKTGFSKSTVRRRLNLLDLDPVQFKASSDRGATLMDYAELDKIKDPDRKNRALQAIGTNNFQYVLKNEIDKEKGIEKLNQIIEKLKSFATECDEEKRATLKYVDWLYRWNLLDSVPEEPEENVPYYYCIGQSESAVGLYREYTQEELEALKNEPDAEEKKKAEEELQKKRDVLEEISVRALRLRMEFVRKTKTTKKQITDLLEATVYTMWSLANPWYDIDEEILCELMNLNGEKDHDEEEVFQALQKLPSEQAVFILNYCGLEDIRGRFFQRWGYTKLKHYKNEKLEDVYRFLEKFGYQISDEERAMMEGTHEYLRESE